MKPRQPYAIAIEVYTRPCWFRRLLRAIKKYLP